MVDWSSQVTPPKTQTKIVLALARLKSYSTVPTEP